MSMKINYNVSAIIANNSLKINDNKLTGALERLSSGYKINSAKDDAAGLAISRRMNAQIKGLNAAEQDAKDGISVVEIADGALAEVQDMLQRMNELAIKSANGTMVDGDREYIQQEISSLCEEIDRIGKTTEFNGQNLFDGGFDLKGYTNDIKVKVDYYSDAIDVGTYKFTLSDQDMKFTVDENGIAKLTEFNGDSECKVTLTKPDGTTPEDFVVSGDIYHLTFTGDSGDEFKLDISQYNKDATSGERLEKDKEEGDEITVTFNSDSFSLELNGYGAMTFQVGANESQTIDVRFQKLSLETLGFKNQDTDPMKDMVLNVSTQKGALMGIDLISDAIGTISSMRSKLGASQNRLEHTESNLTVSNENMTAAYSRIMDTDMAEEMTNYSNLQIVSQAATSILAQANERPSQMLQLLQ